MPAELLIFETSDDRTHLVTTRAYDSATLNLVSTTASAAPGWQVNGHRADCRCGTCRPDIYRLPS